MSGKKKSQNSHQPSLFNILDDGSIIYTNPPYSIIESDYTQKSNKEISSNNKCDIDDDKNNNLSESITDSNCITNTKLQNVQPRTKKHEESKKLIIPIKFEDIVKIIGKSMAIMAKLIVPVTEFEEKIIQVVSDIDWEHINFVRTKELNRL